MNLHASDEAPAQLLARHEGVQPAEYTLEAELTTIGRARTCDIVVLQNLVSRLHAKIERVGPRYVLRDAGSANGTFINSRRIHEPHLLEHDDLIGLGSPVGLLHFIDPDPTEIATASLRYDDRTMTFYLGRQPIDLPPTQFRLLLHLYQHTGNVCTRESCAQAIWGRDYDPGLDAAALDETLSKVRGKLRQIDPEVDIIKTRRGLGFELQL
jgi:DNA-binding response OmpR family regulator